MRRWPLVLSAALVAGLVTPAPRITRASCDVRSALAPVKAALERASAVRVRTIAGSQQQYGYLQTARRELNAAPQMITAACGSDGLAAMTGQETTTVYRAWTLALTADRAHMLGTVRPDCTHGLRIVAESAVANGWGLLGRVVHERPRPDAFVSTRALLEVRAQRLGLVPLPALGNDAGLTAFERNRQINALGAAANLPPLCTHY